MNEPTGPDDTFQLSFCHDVPGETLSAPGALLRDFFPSERNYFVTGREESISLARLPARGCRLISLARR